MNESTPVLTRSVTPRQLSWLRAELAFARKVLSKEALTGKQLRAALADAFPARDPAALAYACRNRIPLVQVPPRGLWRRRAQVSSMALEAWLGAPIVKRPSIDQVVLRYLGAFGPALVADVAAWSGLRM